MRPADGALPDPPSLHRPVPLLAIVCTTGRVRVDMERVRALHRCLEPVFPVMEVLARILNVGCPADALEEGAADDGAWNTHRPVEVHDEDRPLLVGVVQDFMVVSIVEDEELPLLPGADTVVHPHRATLPLRGNDQAEMTTDDPLRDAAMRRNVITRRENREPGAAEIGNRFEQPRRFRATGAVALGLVAEPVENVGLPPVSARDLGLIGRDRLEGRQVLPRLEDRFAFGADRLPVPLERLEKRESRRLEHRRVADQGLPPEKVAELPDAALSRLLDVAAPELAQALQCSDRRLFVRSVARLHARRVLQIFQGKAFSNVLPWRMKGPSAQTSGSATYCFLSSGDS